MLDILRKYFLSKGTQEKNGGAQNPWAVSLCGYKMPPAPPLLVPPALPDPWCELDVGTYTAARVQGSSWVPQCSVPLDLHNASRGRVSAAAGQKGEGICSGFHR